MKNKLLENIFSLVGLKGIEYILSFLLIPYLVRTLGVEVFGLIAFMQGIIQYLLIIVDYGFNMTGPRNISIALSKEDTLGKVFSSIMMSKLLLLILTTVVGTIAIVILKQWFTIDYLLILVLYTLVIGNVLFPIWYYQGIQEMRYITIFNVISKSICAILIFILVKSPNDYILAAFLQSIPMCLSGLISMGYMVIYNRHIFVKVNFKDIKQCMVDGWHVFISTIAINIYTTTNIVVLGLLTSNTIVGYFSAANKLLDAIRGVMNAITQAVYPKVSQLSSENQFKMKLFLSRFSKLYVGMWGGVSLITALLSSYIIFILFGVDYEPSIAVLRILAWIPLIVAISNIFGVQLMLNNGMQRTFSKILLLAAIIDLVIIVPSIYSLAAVGAATVMLITECIVTIATSYYGIRYLKRIR